MFIQGAMFIVFCQMFQGLRLFKGVRLFRTLEYLYSILLMFLALDARNEIILCNFVLRYPCSWQL
jgi:hypothetical protein